MNKLYLFFGEELVGCIEKTPKGLRFSYDASWKKFALSPNFTDFEKIYESHEVTPFFENLLPEGRVRKSIESIEQLESDDPFSFLENHGEDLIGAFEVRKSIDYQGAKLIPQKKQITSQELYEIFKKDNGVINYWKSNKGIDFSIPGAQEKCSIYYNRKKIYFYKNMSSNYIVKGPHHVLNFPNSSVFNEFFCLKLADSIGLGVVDCEIVGDINSPLLFVKRYDRNKGEKIHQIDFLQASLLPSKYKYEKNGGPTLKELYALLIEVSCDGKDRIRFLDWLIFNILIGNNDSHAKNLGFIVTDRGYRLTPFYDLISTAIYVKEGIAKNFAFKLNGQSDAKKFTSKHFHWLEGELGLNKGYILKRAKTHIIPRILKSLVKVQDKFEESFGKNKTIDEIVEYIHKRINFLE
ncbi:HipA domain-containing protein [Halobacteriovorax sp.]|uniref:HipA domain-containing protein n=1 Tax=Halobacteriovorax sp. TaxID=2020862 RepID=UPI003561A5FA